MIQKNLNTNIELVDKLIKLTEEDITHIQQGRHDTVAQSVKDKNKLIALFEVSKKELDEILIKLSDNGTKNIAEILDKDDKAKLGEFKKKSAESGSALYRFRRYPASSRYSGCSLTYGSRSPQIV